MALESGSAILNFVEARRAEFEEAHLVTALHRLAKSRDGHSLLGNAVLRDLIRSLHVRISASCSNASSQVVTPRHLANTVWALARLSASEVRLIQDRRHGTTDIVLQTWNQCWSLSGSWSGTSVPHVLNL